MIYNIIYSLYNYQLYKKYYITYYIKYIINNYYITNMLTNDALECYDGWMGCLASAKCENFLGLVASWNVSWKGR